MLRSPALFFAVPLLLGVASTAVTFELPFSYLAGMGWLVVLALLALCLDQVLCISLPPRTELKAELSKPSREAIVGLGIGWLVVAACVVDLVAFPLPLLHPAIYADFSGGRSYVRHISNMCWILPVIGVLCTRRTVLRAMFITCGLVFPILVLDRNRLFAGVYAVIAIMIVFAKANPPLKKVALALLALLVAFGQLGKLRSGNLEWLSLPFSTLYSSLSPGIKWLLVYVSAGTYNFSSIMAKGYRNDDFLVNQLIPGAASGETVHAAIPFDEPVINVGTEYFPFLMAFGPIGAALAAIGLYLGLLASVILLRRRPSLFTFLIFLRLSYVCIMAGFAPQAYVWTNFGFVISCIGFLIFASVLPRNIKVRLDRNAAASRPNRDPIR